MNRWRAHDLLQVRTLRPSEGEPAWVRDALRRAPFVVVRRAQSACGLVAVGVRGLRRSERHPTWVAAADVVGSFAPEDLSRVAPPDERRAMPAFVALATLGERSPRLGLYVWGPCGSAGFELATGVPTVTRSSDLDLLIRAPQALGHEAAARLLDEIRQHTEREGVRVDVQLETPAGGVALSELALGKGRVVARHACGPELLVDPWIGASAGSRRG